MPTYVYKFIDSGETIEVQQAFVDEALTSIAHPSDGTVRAVKKVFTPVGVSFKGGGFYKTDSSSSNKDRPSKDSPDTAPSTPATTSESGSTNTSTPATTSESGSTNTSTTAPAVMPASAPAATTAK